MKLVLTVLGTAILFAQTKPDFTGTWKLDPAKSNFGGDQGVEEMTVKIRHREPEFVLIQVRREGNEEFKLATDGKEYTNASRGVPLKTVLTWQGGALSAVSTADTPNGALKLEDRMALSADGKTMKIVRRYNSATGETKWELHFDKRAEPAQNLSGNWTVLPAKSNFGSMPPPKKMTQDIDHRDPYFRVQTAQTGENGELKFDLTYRTDGEAANTVGTLDVKSKGRWEAGSLLIDSVAGDIVINDKWTLSKDGKTLTLVRDYADPQTKTVLTIVHEKR